MTELREPEQRQLDRKDLKILAYKEKLAQLEEANADLRVELTILSQQLQEALSTEPVSEDGHPETQED